MHRKCQRSLPELFISIRVPSSVCRVCIFEGSPAGSDARIRLRASVAGRELSGRAPRSDSADSKCSAWLQINADFGSRARGQCGSVCETPNASDWYHSLRQDHQPANIIEFPPTLFDRALHVQCGDARRKRSSSDPGP